MIDVSFIGSTYLYFFFRSTATVAVTPPCLVAVGRQLCLGRIAVRASFAERPPWPGKPVRADKDSPPISRHTLAIWAPACPRLGQRRHTQAGLYLSYRCPGRRPLLLAGRQEDTTETVG